MNIFKKIVLVLSSFGVVFFNSCLLEEFDPVEWAIDPELEFESQTLTFGPTKETQVMRMRCNYNNCSIYSTAEWCQVTANTDSLYIVIEVDANYSSLYRTAEVSATIERGNKSLTKSFSVIQNGGDWELVGDWRVFWEQGVNSYQKTIITSMIQNLVRVQKGTFLMGGQGIDSLAANYYPYLFDSSEVHRVTLSKDYYINRYEVSQKEWIAIMEDNPSRFIGDELPVDNISWNNAVQFTERLSNMTGLNFRLPTSAQWEYAARGGLNSFHYFYSGSDTFEDVGKYVSDESDPGFTTDHVGSYSPNELGLYNMSGNVAELCTDWMGYYTGEDEIDPIGSTTGGLHLTRGGSFRNPPSIRCSVYSRFILDGSAFNGLRIIVMP